MGPAKAQPVIIIKKKVAGHGGHHGGAWKVAYADFVTAMMALFIVLWLMNSNKAVREAVGGYFQDPTAPRKSSAMIHNNLQPEVSLTIDNMSRLKDDLKRAIRDVTNFDKLKDQVEMILTAEGLRVELLEAERSTFFASGSSDPTTAGSEVLCKLAQELGKLPNEIVIEGHTDAKALNSKNGSYSNWELSVDRANSARRIMLENGLRPGQITQVRGFAEQRLRKRDAPDDPSNRRISLIVQYQPRKDPPADAKGKPAEGGHGKEAAPPAAAGGHGGH